MRGLRRGGMTGAEQEVEGTLVRESEIKETRQEEKDEEGKQKWKKRGRCHEEKQQQRRRNERQMSKGRGKRGEKRKKSCINSQAKTEVMGGSWKDS